MIKVGSGNVPQHSSDTLPEALAYQVAEPVFRSKSVKKGSKPIVLFCKWRRVRRLNEHYATIMLRVCALVRCRRKLGAPIPEIVTRKRVQI